MSMKKAFHFLAILLMATAIKAQQPKLMLPLAHTSRITDIDFSPDGKKFVTAANDNTAKIWETN